MIVLLEVLKRNILILKNKNMNTMSIMIVLICFLPFLLKAQQLDVLFETRKKYSSKNNFAEYCMYKYMECKIPLTPPTPFDPKLKRYFRIPKKVLLDIFPFNDCDSIVLHLVQADKKIVLNQRQKLIFADVVFNYSYNNMEDEWYKQCDRTGCVRIKFIFHDSLTQTNKYVELLYGGQVRTDFTPYELSQFPIDWGKIELFLKKIKVK